jgi:hypothetical protein
MEETVQRARLRELRALQAGRVGSGGLSPAPTSGREANFCAAWQPEISRQRGLQPNGGSRVTAPNRSSATNAGAPQPPGHCGSMGHVTIARLLERNVAANCPRMTSTQERGRRFSECSKWGAVGTRCDLHRLEDGSNDGGAHQEPLLQRSVPQPASHADRPRPSHSRCDPRTMRRSAKHADQPSHRVEGAVKEWGLLHWLTAAPLETMERTAACERYTLGSLASRRSGRARVT